MSLLWEYRYQLDGLRPLIEIAHWAVIFHIPPEDQNDVEQEIVIRLIQTVEKYGNKVGIDLDNLDLKGKRYLRKVARSQRSTYFLKKVQELREKEFCNIGDSFEDTRAVSYDNDADARLDAMATLATLPERLIQLGHKILYGEKLSDADQAYRIRQLARLRPKLNCRKRADHISDGEKNRILQLHCEDVSVHKIAITMGRADRTILRVLDDYQMPSRRNRLAKERDERIRHAYFVDGKSTSIIARDFHHGLDTVYRAIKTE
ncbi:hypothetical protein ES703_80093 [subsurface metagenome]